MPRIAVVLLGLMFAWPPSLPLEPRSP